MTPAEGSTSLGRDGPIIIMVKRERSTTVCMCMCVYACVRYLQHCDSDAVFVGVLSPRTLLRKSEHHFIAVLRHREQILQEHTTAE